MITKMDIIISISLDVKKSESRALKITEATGSRAQIVLTLSTIYSKQELISNVPSFIK